MSNNMPIDINIQDGYLRYLDNAVPTIEHLNLEIPSKSWTCILGRSGCGKTTLLRYLAGLVDADVQSEGEWVIKPTGTDLKNNIAYMAQQDLLMPWLSVVDNVLLSSKFGSQLHQDQTAKALELLNQVGLAGYEHKTPQQLSGGMRQRVALARTLMQDKSVVLMDEPFSALDAVTRHKLQQLACELLNDKTVILITHDPQEAIRLADKIYILQGKPSSAACLQVPSTPTPRNIDAEYAELQQHIMQNLENDSLERVDA